MLTGAFFGIWGTVWSGSWVVGLVVAMLAGAVVALVHAVFAIHLRADQIVTGTAINFLALGVTGYLFIDIYGSNGTPASIDSVPDIPLPGIRSIPGIGGVFGSLNLMIWLVFGLLVLTAGHPVPHADRPSHPLGRRAPAGGRHGRHPGLPDPLHLRPPLRDARGPRRRLPVDRLRRVVRPEHDRRARVHRPGRGHLRQVAARTARSGRACSSASRAAWPTGSSRWPASRRTC